MKFVLKIIYVVFVFLPILFSCSKSENLELAPKKPSRDAQPQKPEQAGVCGLFFKVERICVELTWEIIPTKTEAGSFIFKYFVQENPVKLVDPVNQPAVALRMSGGEFSTKPVKLEKLAVGEYKASNVVLDKTGEWEIWLQLKDAKAVIDQVVKKTAM